MTLSEKMEAPKFEFDPNLGFFSTCCIIVILDVNFNESQYRNSLASESI